MKIKTVLKRLLYEHEITVAELSRSTRILRQTIDNWLSGQDPRNLNQLKRVANYFQISLDKLCFDESEEIKAEISDYSEEINAGLFEVVLRRIKK